MQRTRGRVLQPREEAAPHQARVAKQLSHIVQRRRGVVIFPQFVDDCLRLAVCAIRLQCCTYIRFVLQPAGRTVVLELR